MQQIRRPLNMNRLSIGPQLRTTSVLVVYLLLINLNTGQSKLIGSSQPIVATVGDDIILPCHLEPAVDVAAMTLEWTRSDLDPRYVLVLRAGQDLVNTKHPLYRGRTSLFTDELKQGNISLKLSKVKLSDEGKYQCFVPKLNEASFVELVVGAAASPIISLAGIEGDKGGVVLQCESKGWYPEPELLWLDTEGKILSAGPTETVRGPDDLYTVSSRLTVEKRHSNNIICRVQQSNINQTRETQIHISDDFFNFKSGSSAATVGLALSLAFCLSILLLVFFLWKKNIIKFKRRDENDHASKKTFSKSKAENQISVEEDREGEQLMTHESVQMEVYKRKGENTKHLRTSGTDPAESSSCLGNLRLVSRQRFHEEKQRRQEAENKVQKLEEDLKTKTEEISQLGTKLEGEEQNRKEGTQMLEKTKKELNEQLQTETKSKEEAENLNKELEKKIRELEAKLKTEEKNRKEETQKLENTKKETSQLETKLQTEKQDRMKAESLNTKLLEIITKVNQLMTEDQKLTFRNQGSFGQKHQLGNKIKELEKLLWEKLGNSEEQKTLKQLLVQITELQTKLQTEEENVMKAEILNKQKEGVIAQVNQLMTKIQNLKSGNERSYPRTHQPENKIQELEKLLQKNQKDCEEVKSLKQLLEKIPELEKQLQTEKKKNEEAETKIKEVNQLKTEVQKLKEEKQRSEDQRQQQENELETKNRGQETRDLPTEQTALDTEEE